MPSEERPQAEGGEETSGWSDTLAYGGGRNSAAPKRDEESEHWNRWHYGLYLASVLLLVGALEVSLSLLLLGYVLVPITMYLDSRYLESVTVGWQADTGLHVVGSLLFPVLMVPAYLYRRRELRSPGDRD